MTLPAISILLLLLASSNVSAFSTTKIVNSASFVIQPVSGMTATTRLYASETNDTTVAASETSTSSTNPEDKLYIPLSLDEMVKQTSQAMEDAMQQNINRQTIRILLPRSSDNDQLGQYYESQVVDEQGTSKDIDMVLVPPDETWQGGIMQLYRAASLAAQEILRYVE